MKVKTQPLRDNNKAQASKNKSHNNKNKIGLNNFKVKGMKKDIVNKILRKHNFKICLSKCNNDMINCIQRKISNNKKVKIDNSNNKNNILRKINKNNKINHSSKAGYKMNKHLMIIPNYQEHNNLNSKIN